MREEVLIIRQEEIKLRILNIQYKYYTPNSKIARDCGFDNSLISKLINDKLEDPLSDNVLSRLEKWLEIRE